MRRRNNQRRRNHGRGPIIHVHNTANASAKSRSDACLVWAAALVAGLGSVVAACVALPGLTPVAAGTAVAYTAHMLRQS